MGAVFTLEVFHSAQSPSVVLLSWFALVRGDGHFFRILPIRQPHIWVAASPGVKQNVGRMGLRKTRAQLRDQAYERLGVTREQVSAVPQISYLLRRLDGGRLAAINLLRGSDNPDARRFLEVYDDAPATSRAHLPIEAFCIVACVLTYRLAGIVLEEAVRQGALCSALIVASNLPRIMKKTVGMALTDSGVEDRKIMLQATGFLPISKGSTTAIVSVLQAARRGGSLQPTALPSMEAKRRHVLPVLPAGQPVRLNGSVREDSAQEVDDEETL